MALPAEQCRWAPPGQVLLGVAPFPWGRIPNCKECDGIFLEGLEAEEVSRMRKTNPTAFISSMGPEVWRKVTCSQMALSQGVLTLQLLEERGSEQVEGECFAPGPALGASARGPHLQLPSSAPTVECVAEVVPQLSEGPLSI